MRFLVACEESQAVAIELRKLGHEAFSCDLQDCSGGHPEWHIKDDVLNVLSQPWDRVISFQPCTDIATSGARWFPEKRANGSQKKSLRFFFDVWRKSNCSENPRGILSGGKYIKTWFPELYEEMSSCGFPFKPSQVIQPWQFGHPEQKATCLFLRDLPCLIPTNIVEGREQKVWKMSRSKERGKLRSKTYPGIASAMAHQFTNPF